jgi:hypothetical protein
LTTVAGSDDRDDDVEGGGDGGEDDLSDGSRMEGHGGKEYLAR